MIAHSLRKIHISENKEKITDQRLIYQYIQFNSIQYLLSFKS